MTYLSICYLILRLVKRYFTNYVGWRYWFNLWDPIYRNRLKIMIRRNMLAICLIAWIYCWSIGVKKLFNQRWSILRWGVIRSCWLLWDVKISILCLLLKLLLIHLLCLVRKFRLRLLRNWLTLDVWSTYFRFWWGRDWKEKILMSRWLSTKIV